MEPELKSDINKKSLLIVLTQAPLASSNNQEAFDLALAAASFDQDVTLVFEGDAIYQLTMNQNPSDVGRKNLPKMMKAFPMYGIEKLYVFMASDQGDMKVPDNIAVLDDQSYRQLLSESDSVIRF